jgi:hypothetical protein
VKKEVFVIYPAALLLPFPARMFDDPGDALSRRQLLTQALPRGLASLARGALELREQLSAQVADAIAPRPALALDPEEVALWRDLRESQARLRRQHPDLFPDDEQEMPDPGDSEAFWAWIRDGARRRAGQWPANLAAGEEGGGR